MEVTKCSDGFEYYKRFNANDFINDENINSELRKLADKYRKGYKCNFMLEFGDDTVLVMQAGCSPIQSLISVIPQYVSDAVHLRDNGVLVDELPRNKFPAELTQFYLFHNEVHIEMKSKDEGRLEELINSFILRT